MPSSNRIILDYFPEWSWSILHDVWYDKHAQTESVVLVLSHLLLFTNVCQSVRSVSPLNATPATTTTTVPMLICAPCAKGPPTWCREIRKMQVGQCSVHQHSEMRSHGWPFLLRLRSFVLSTVSPAVTSCLGRHPACSCESQVKPWEQCADTSKDALGHVLRDVSWEPRVFQVRMVCHDTQKKISHQISLVMFLFLQNCWCIHVVEQSSSSW